MAATQRVSEAVFAAANRYVREIKRLGKGGKKAEAAGRWLLDNLPAEPTVWDPGMWGNLLERLEGAAESNPVMASEIHTSYSAAHAEAERIWEQWKGEFRDFREELGRWVEGVGIRRVPLDLAADKPAREIARANKEFSYDPENDSPEWSRAKLALFLDPTLKYDVEWGASFEQPVPDIVTTWPVPWALRWPLAYPGRSLINVVFRLIGGNDAASIQDWFSHYETLTETRTTGIVRTQRTLVILRRSDLLLLSWQETNYQPRPNWNTYTLMPYDGIEIKDPTALRKGEIRFKGPDHVPGVGFVTLRDPTERAIRALKAAKRGIATSGGHDPGAANAGSRFVDCPGCGNAINSELDRCPICQAAVGAI